jgi:hypothetical protein
MHANPFALKEYSLEEALTRFQEWITLRQRAGVTTAELIELLPLQQLLLARRRFCGGGEMRCLKLAQRRAMPAVRPHMRAGLRYLDIACVIGGVARSCTALRELRCQEIKLTKVTSASSSSSASSVAMAA